MSYCLNPYCASPNSESAKFCCHCGFKLLLGDRYRALQPIGRGGFGRTFLSVDEYKPSRPRCVIKQFFPQGSVHNPERARELFRREAIQLEQLGSHPQIPDLLAHFEQENYQYLVQEFIDGNNLLLEVTQHGAFSDRQVWQLLNDLLPVLDYVHQHQVIHRDIKPQNIIRRSSNQQYVLVDFGAAKSINSVDFLQTGTSIGSPEFVAPEQAMGKATFASDLYSLGVTCAYLLTQVRPTELYDTGEGCWVWRHHLPHAVNDPLSDLLDRLLVAPLNRRYASARDVLADLNSESILRSLEVSDQAGLRLAPSVPLPDNSRDATSAQAALELDSVTRLPASALLQPMATAWANTHTLTGHQNWVRSVVVHPNGRTLASGSGDRTLKFWELETGTLLRTIPAHDSWVRAIAASPDGRWLASCSNDRTVKLWDWETGNLRHTLAGHTDWVRAVAFQPDGRLLASSGQDRSIRLWNPATGEPVTCLKGHDHWITTIAFVPNSHWLISGSRDTTLQVWNWRTGSSVGVLKGHTSTVTAIALSPNGQILVSASDDGTLRLWDWRSGKLRKVLTGHEATVSAIAVTADGSTLISTGHDRTIKLWDLASGELRDTFIGHPGWVWSVAVSPDGKTIVSGGWDATIKIWRSEWVDRNEESKAVNPPPVT